MKKTIVYFWLLVTILIATREPRINSINSTNSDARRSPLAMAGAGSEWLMFHHDPAHLGYTISPAPKTSSVRWKYRTGNWVYSSPAVADGMVFIGSYDNNVYALDEMTGALVWNYSCGDMVRSSPAVADGIVFVGSYDHNVYALNKTTGEKIWNYETGDAVVSSPVVVDGMVFVGSFDGSVYSLDEMTGERIWSRDVDLAHTMSSPAFDGGMVFIGTSRGSVHALNEHTGTEVWSFKNESSPIDCSPAVANGRVFVAGTGIIYAFNETTGARIWDFHTGMQMSSSPAVADGMIFIGAYPAGIYALNETTGDLIWTTYPGIGCSSSSPAIADNMLFVGQWGGSGYVHALDEFTGTVIWTYSTGFDVTGFDVASSPAVADGMMFIGVGGDICCFGPSVNVKPVLHSINPSNDTVTSSSNVELSWNCTYIISIDHYSVKVDNESWIDVGNSHMYAFKGLANGNHTAHIQAVDRGGLNSTVSVHFTVNVFRLRPEVVVIIGAVLAIIVIVVTIIIKKSRGLKQSKESGSRSSHSNRTQEILQPTLGSRGSSVRPFASRIRKNC